MKTWYRINSLRERVMVASAMIVLGVLITAGIQMGVAKASTMLDRFAINRVQAKSLIEPKTVEVPVVNANGVNDKLTAIDQKLDQLKP